MNTKIYITGIGRCKEAPLGIDMLKAVKTVIKAEELALSATSIALKQAGLLRQSKGTLWEGYFVSDECGIVFGIDNAIDRNKEEFFKGFLSDGPIGASPLLFPYTSHNAITAQVTIAFGIKGEDITITSGAVSFLKAVDYGFELLQKNIMKVVIAGGVSENEAMVIVMERLSHEEAHKRTEAGISLKEFRGFPEQDIPELSSIEKSFHIVEDFIKGKTELPAKK